jgi:hypothetical protein
MASANQKQDASSIMISFWNITLHLMHFLYLNMNIKETPWPQSASELYRPSGSLLSAKLVPTFADGECRVVSATDPYCRILGFLDRSRYYFFQVAPQL